MPTSELRDVYRSRFEETHWSVVLRARRPDDAGLEALEKLCRAYRLPLYTFVRHRGYNSADAEDLVQSFFLAIIEGNRLKGVDPSNGRFRSFLLASMKNFLANEWDARRALKRGGAFRLVSLHDPELERMYSDLATREEDPDRVFDRGWAIALLDKARAQLAREYDEEGRVAVFNALNACLPFGGKELVYAEAAGKLGMREDNLRNAVHRMRARYGELLRREIKNTLPNPKDVDDELKYLLSCLGKI